MRKNSNKRKKTVFLILAAAAGLALFPAISKSVIKAAGNSSEETQSQTAKETKRQVIGATLASTEASFQEALGNLLMKESEGDTEYQLEICYAQWNAKTQEEQMRNFIEEGVSAIILCPVNAKSQLNVLKDAKRAGIPVINLNMKVDTVSTEYITTYVGASMSEEGYLAAQLVVDYFDGRGGKIGIIEGTQGSDPQIYRTQSFLEYLAAYPEIEVVGLVEGNWSRARAALAAGNLLYKEEDLDLIYCHDSNMALGAYETLKYRGLEDKIKVVGIGNEEIHMDAVRDGRIYGIVSQSPEYEARYAWKCAIQAAKGEKLRAWYQNPVEILTKDNIDQYIAP